MADDQLPANQAEPDATSFLAVDPLVDQTLECRECGDLFLFTIAEQEHYREKGLKHPPSRCPTCRKRLREQLQATMIPVRCRRCKKKGFVPEAIPNAIDLLCEECFSFFKQQLIPSETSEVSAGNSSTSTSPLEAGGLVAPSALSGGANAGG